MEHRTRKQQVKDAARNALINPAEFNVKVLSDEEIRKLYPNAEINRDKFSQKKLDDRQRRNLKDMKKKTKKELAPFSDID